ncbi:hypothetical protein ACWE42_15505 [Sutcliffiella cohnii]
MTNDVKGLCNVNRKGLLKISSDFPNIPAVKRHINNKDSKMQYATARYLSKITKVPLDEIIEIP